jgi:hypothetical protein
MRIPEVRDRLRELADAYSLPELHALADELHRRPPVRKADVSSEPMTGQLAAEIRDYARRHPGASFARIAGVFGVNPGRVSEVLAGKRDERAAACR